MENENGSFADTIASRMKERDALIPSPEQRAKAIWNILNQREKKPTYWDLICFAVETLGSVVTEYPFLRAPVKHIIKYFYSIHYLQDTLMESFINEKGEEK
jgi:hypothetical protein